MRKALIFPFLLVAACNTERTLAPQPQKSALSMCGHEGAGGCRRPLFVVDGKRLPDDGRDLNPSEIATVEVLRGASAIAMFGEDARNGVVVITSKRAVKGPRD